MPIRDSLYPVFTSNAPPSPYFLPQSNTTSGTRVSMNSTPPFMPIVFPCILSYLHVREIAFIAPVSRQFFLSFTIKQLWTRFLEQIQTQTLSTSSLPIPNLLLAFQEHHANTLLQRQNPYYPYRLCAQITRIKLSLNDPNMLIRAITMQFTELSHALIDANSDVNYVENAHPLIKASMQITSIEKRSEGLTCRQTALLAAIEAHLPEIALKVLQAGADPNAKNKRAYSIEEFQNFYKETGDALLPGQETRTLIRHRQARTKQPKNPTIFWKVIPLIAAAAQGSLNVVQSLIEKKAIINQQDALGRTAVFMAAWNGHTSVVEFLVKQKASIALQDKFRCTPLLAASSQEHTAITNLLLGITGVHDPITEQKNEESSLF